MEDTQHVPGDLGTPAPDPKAVVIEKGTLPTLATMELQVARSVLELLCIVAVWSVLVSSIAAIFAIRSRTSFDPTAGAAVTGAIAFVPYICLVGMQVKESNAKRANPNPTVSTMLAVILHTLLALMYAFIAAETNWSAVLSIPSTHAMVLMVVYVSLRLVRYTWRPMATLLCAVGTTMASSIVWWVLAGEGRLVFAVQALMNVLLTLYLMVYLREFFELQSDNYGVGKYEMDRLHANKLIDYYTIPFWALIRLVVTPFQLGCAWWRARQWERARTEAIEVYGQEMTAGGQVYAAATL